MREILFRGKRLDNDEWVEGYYVHLHDPFRGKESHRIYIGYAESECDSNEDLFYPDYFDVVRATVGQFTGRLDKNGKQIFEGDIVKEDLDGAIAVIEFGDYASPFNSDQFTHNIGFYPKWEEKHRRHLRKDLGFYCIYGGVEVIGNVHDNPELWKEEKE